MSAEYNAPGRPDTVGHSSVQAWSAGPLFPAIIAYVERYPEMPRFERFAYGARDKGAARVVYDAMASPSVSYQLTIGAYCEEYATREDAEAVARWACSGGRVIPERYAELLRPDYRPVDPHAFNDAGAA